MSLTQLVNHVATEVGRPALLEDRRQRVVAYSPQSDVIDPVREASILRHRAAPAVSDWLRGLGVYRSREVVHVPANSALGMLPRLCIPVSTGSFSFGHLWFIDAPEAMSASEVTRATRYADAIGDEWRRQDDDEVGSRSVEREYLRVLLTESGSRAIEAAEWAADRLGVAGRAAARAYVIGCDVDAAAEAAEAAEVRAALAMASRRSAGVVGSALWLVRHDHAVVVEAAYAADDIEAAAQRVLSIGEEVLGRFGDVTVGVGPLAPTLAEVRTSYERAREAIRIAHVFQLPDPVTHWERLGAYRGLHAAAERGMRADDFHDVQRLRAERDGDMLLATLAEFLRRGGSMQSTANRLRVHRSSLYHRLSRIETVLGVDLRDGVQRLGLHMAIMLAEAEKSG
ncbi:PucR family transcriptional regulator [Microbacterium terrisoli]|uniref:PucR family transcriptional regulator n=1 Tax=Microbacterium terrisoli TaxID=3242192 RepID=UPI00280448B5|nr:helix-turn-helix domain-containing protein [Microbacterium protaetiae]